MQVVDSSAARRRGGGALVEGVRMEDDYDGDKGEKGEKTAWPSSGIGMESRLPPAPTESPGQHYPTASRKEFAAGGKEGKWEKLIPQRRAPQTWVSKVFFSWLSCLIGGVMSTSDQGGWWAVDCRSP